MEHAAFRPALRGLLTAAALLVLPTLAGAQTVTMSASSTSFAKSDAILGTGSALDRLLVQQGARPAPRETAVVMTSFASAATRPSADLLVPAIAPGPVSADRPDVFNSVALAIGWTPLAARWSRVEHGPADAPATRFAASLTGRDAMRRLEAVNMYVNARVHFVEDRVQYGVEDYWAPAAQTLRRGKGDCEDFAIAKLAMLRAAGFAEHDLYLVIAKDLVRRQDHALAIARANGRLWVLDSGTDQLLDSAEARDYRPVLSFSGAHSWTHGYRREIAPMVIARAPEPTILAPAPLVWAPVQVAALPLPPLSSLWPQPAADQRSRSASLLAFNTGFSK